MIPVLTEAIFDSLPVSMGSGERLLDNYYKYLAEVKINNPLVHKYIESVKKVSGMEAASSAMGLYILLSMQEVSDELSRDWPLE